MTQPHEHIQTMTPEYWAGYDIHNAQLFQEAERTPPASLSFRECKQARNYLIEGVGQVAAGNATEIRYGVGMEFNTDLPDGSLLVVDTEYLSKTIFDDSKPARSGPRATKPRPAIVRPYSTFWLNNQDGTEKPNVDLGTEAVTVADAHTICTYTRTLDWGVVMTHGQDRVIKPFSFGATRLLADGTVYVPPARQDYERVERMPVPIGKVVVGRRLNIRKHGYTIDALDRVRSVDVVHLGSGDKERQRRRLPLGFALPKFGFSGA